MTDHTLADDVDDPFSPLADPYAPQPGAAAVDALPENPDDRTAWPLSLSRRTLLAAAVIAPLAAQFGGCTRYRLGCEPLPRNKTSCRHRFCRYYKRSG